MNSEHVYRDERDMSGLLLSEALMGLPGHLGGIRLLEFNSDDRRFLSVDLDMCLRVYQDEQEISSFYLKPSFAKTVAHDRVHGVVFAPGGRFAYVAGGLHFHCLDLELGKEVWAHKPKDLFGFLQTSPRAVGITQSGEIFVCNDSGAMELWNLDGQMVKKKRSNDTPNMICRMHDGHTFVGSDGFGLTVWDPSELRRMMQVKWVDVHVYGVAASPTEPIVAARSVGVVGVFNIETQEMVTTIPIQPGLPFIEFSPDGQKILVGQGRGVVLFDLNGVAIDSVSYMNDRILSAKFRPSNGDVYVGLESGGIETFETS